MPNNLDFSNVKEIKEMEVNPENWVNPLYVEYGISEITKYGGVACYCWRVKGTQHTFVIPIARIDYVSSGDYKKHFENALELFREDYLAWKGEGFIYEWAREYRNQFSKFIIV